jgi:hypothetical protein
MAISDEYFGPAYLDVDEWRDEPVRHRYVHGGFEGTDTRFSFYFPSPEAYRRRLISWIEGGQGGNEMTAAGPVSGLGVMSSEFAASVGAILVESNQGHLGADLGGCDGDSSILSWRASAESARYAKQMAKEMYGAAPEYAYVTGGSGGGVRSINCFERTDVWQGAVPFVIPHPGQGPFFSLLANVIRLLTPQQRKDLAERTGLGGSGDPFEGLDIERREALSALYRAGFPRGAEFVLSNPFEAVLVWSWNSSELMEHDPGYWEDFWTVAGYAGADGPVTLAPHLLEEKSTVKRVVTAGDLLNTATPEEWSAGGAAGVIGMMTGATAPQTPIAVVVEGLERDQLALITGAKVQISSGKGAGRLVVCLGAVGDALVCSASGEDGNTLFDEVVPGDEVTISNRDFIAYCFYNRTQTSLDHDQFGEYYPEFTQYLVDGRPMYPGRKSYGFEAVIHTLPYQYRWSGKMILCQNLHDVGTWPVGAVNYHRRVLKLRGEEETNRDFRVWWFDHAAHVPGSMFPSSGRPAASTRLIDYGGCVQQAMKDLMAWVEQGAIPPASASYDYSPGDGLVQLAPSAEARHGIQPVPSLTCNAKIAASVQAGDEVRFEMRAEVPPGAGEIMRVEWDWTGDGQWESDDAAPLPAADISVVRERTYKESGTYFPTVRVTGHRDGEKNAALSLIPNLAQVRVVVS